MKIVGFILGINIFAGCYTGMTRSERSRKRVVKNPSAQSANFIKTAQILQNLILSQVLCVIESLNFCRTLCTYYVLPRLTSSRSYGRNKIPMHSLLACLSLFLMLQTDASETTAADIEVRGVGASFPALVYQDLIFAYQFVKPNVKLSYLASGSGSGKCRIQVRSRASRPHRACALCKETLFVRYAEHPTLCGAGVCEGV